MTDSKCHRFNGKKVLVTGAGKGIGRSIAVLLSAQGARVVALSRTEDDLIRLQKEIECEIIVADLSDSGQILNAVRQAGEVDLLVNNAGISIPQRFLDTTIDTFDKTLAVNLRAAFLVSQIVVRNLIERMQAGAIVNISSQASMVGLMDHTAYCVSKGGLDQLTRVMAVELGAQGIRVNSVNPTVTLTPMGEMAWSDASKSQPMLDRIPMRRFAKPVEVAEVVAFLLSEEASMIHGSIIPVDGGFLAT